MSRHYANTGILSLFILRKDRIRIPVWVVSIVGFTIFCCNASDLYTTGADRQIMAKTMKTRLLPLWVPGMAWTIIPTEL